MMLTQRRLARLSIFVSGAVLTSCGQAKEPPRPSILPELERMQPVFDCIEATPQGANSEIESCAKKGGIDVNELPREPKKADEFKPLIVATWVFFDQDKTTRLASKNLPSMIDYARCIESNAYADRAFASRTAKGVAEAKFRAETACEGHPLSFRGLKPEQATTASDARERMLAKLMAASAINYALEANGWYPDEMRPCIKYLDGRPPSIGCSLNPQPEMASPPPPTGYRPQ
ncbi:MAG: hypothetical protein E6R00_00695 [Gammaproteobacteria bacterium]|nr:MAG: hypothetical protein E6R00_00695 [Gammaproteobacteria bacterium]